MVFTEKENKLKEVCGLSKDLKDINYGQFTYTAEDTDVLPYTEAERLLMINHLDDDNFYSLAIKFGFYMILRIWELKGLR